MLKLPSCRASIDAVGRPGGDLLPSESFVLGNTEYRVYAIPENADMRPVESVCWKNLRASRVGVIRIDGKTRWIAEAHPSFAEHLVSKHAGGMLTPRELQVIKLVADGLGNKGVAARLCISEATVATHLRRVFAKLCVDNRAAMVHRCAALLAMSDIDVDGKDS